ncbi:MAG TPA: DNA repair protein RecO [Atribacteraceae bacterium]|nr:DNA repair protein RecO [Atribacteraceae bacterium]
MNPEPDRYWNDEGLVIRTVDYGEKDRIVILFTRRRGKISAIARGIRKSGSRFGTALDPGTFSSILMYRGRGLPHVTQAEIRTSCRKFLTDPPRWAVVSYCLNLIADCYEPESPDIALYEEVHAIFSLLAQCSNWQTLLMKFRVDLLGFLGIRPHIFRCAACGRQEGREVFSWNVQSGGLVCQGCSVQGGITEPFLPDLRLILERIASQSVRECQKLRFSRRQFFDLDRLLAAYYRHHLERKTPDWFSFSRRFPV